MSTVLTHRIALVSVVAGFLACRDRRDVRPTTGPDGSPASVVSFDDSGGPASRRVLAVLASGQHHPKFVALSEGAVFFTTYEDAAVRRVAMTGGPVATLTTGLEDAYGIAVTRGVVVAAGRTSEGRVVRFDASARDGGALDVARVSFPSSVALDITAEGAADARAFVVWVTRDTVERARLDGREHVVLAAHQAGPHAVAAARGLTAWTSYHGGEVHVTRVARGARRIAAGLDHPAGLAIAGDEALVACTGDGTIRAFRLEGDAGAGRIVATGLSLPTEIAVDTGFVYFTSASGVVGKVALAGGAVTVIADGQGAPTGIAVGDDAVFWANDQDGTIVRASPK